MEDAGKNEPSHHDFVIKDGKFIGKFEEMYRVIEDPWHHGMAEALQYDIALFLLKRNLSKKNLRILDIGCGKGAFTSRIKKELGNSEILAVDVSPTAIEKARKQFGSPSIDFQAIDIVKDFDKITGTFDLIVVSQILWYVLPDFEELVKKLRGRLNRKGKILVIQAFYPPEKQKYGKEIASSVEDMVRLVGMKIVEMAETGRFSGHCAIVLFEE